MVWEQRVGVIVMITNFVEQGKKKCDQYWPETGSVTYGIFSVQMLQEDIRAHFTIRKFRLYNTKINRKDKISYSRDVTHYQYTSWPDYGTPVDVLPVLAFIKKSSSDNLKENDLKGPMVVHCSAGVGRTGTYIVIEAMIKQLKAKGEINILSFLGHIRQQRHFLVQTEEQYIFIHDVLAEAVSSGETIIKSSYLSRYINSLQSNFTTEESTWQLLQSQFSQITVKKPLESHFTVATIPCNQLKNQSFDFLPIDSTRTKLQVINDTEGSDYINASWIPGFHSQSEYIITQHPKEQTTFDLWRLVWEYDIHTVVLLSKIDDQEFYPFWPEDEQIIINKMTVRHTEEGLLSGYLTKDFRLEYGDSTPHIVRMIFCPEWDNLQNRRSLERSAQPSMDILPVIHTRQDNLPPRPLLVIDQVGGTSAATYCSLSTLLRQLRNDDCVDIYTTAKSVHNHRPGVWTKPEDIFYLYKVIEAQVSKKHECSEVVLKRQDPDGKSDEDTFSDLPTPPPPICEKSKKVHF